MTDASGAAAAAIARAMGVTRSAAILESRAGH